MAQPVHGAYNLTAYNLLQVMSDLLCYDAGKSVGRQSPIKLPTLH